MKPTSPYLLPSVAYSTSELRNLNRLKARRKRWLDVHLWLGLTLGFFLALFGLTGSVLVFYEEIDNLLNTDLRQIPAQTKGESAYHPLSEILAAAKTSLPSEAKLGFVDYPADNETTYKFGFNFPTTTPEKIDEWFVYVDPYQARVIGKQLIKKADELLPHPLIPFVFRLHFALLAGETGGIIVGIMGVILVFSLLTGLIVWWPLTGHWRRALTIKHHASAKRLNHDLHQTFGFYSFPVLLAILLSGVYMNLPDPFMVLVKQLSPGTQGFNDTPHSSPAQGRSPIGLGQALTIARNRYPKAVSIGSVMPRVKQALISLASVTYQD